MNASTPGAVRIGGLLIPPSLLAINPHLAAPKARPRSSSAIDIAVQREGAAVVLVAKGLRLVNDNNQREHWAVAYRRASKERRAIAEALAGVPAPALPVRVEIIRTGPRHMDDDGATISAKHVRDELARWCGVDDGDDERFVCTVVRAAGRYAVHIRVQPAR